MAIALIISDVSGVLKTGAQLEAGDKISDLPKLSEISHPKPVSEIFLA